MIELKIREIKYFFKIVNIGRFPLEIIGACIQKLINSGTSIIRTMSHNNSVDESLVFNQRPDFPGDLVPVHVVHVLVRYDQMDVVLGFLAVPVHEVFNRHVSVRQLVDFHAELMVQLFEKLRKRKQVAPSVVNQQNVHCENFTSSYKRSHRRLLFV